MKTAPEAAIIGGGPCGSFTALNLAKRGIDVAVFEEHKEVGVPCHCPGHVSIEGLRKLGLAPLPKEVVENTFRGACFHSPAGETFEVNFSSPITCTVNRNLFDKHVAGLAKEAGARFYLDSHVESLITEKGQVKGIIVKQNGKIAKVSAKIVIDAEGISSKLLKQAGLPAPNRNFIVNGVSTEAEHVREIESDKVEVFLGRNFAPGFYAWLIPKGEEKAKVGLAAKRENPERLLKNFMLKHPVASKKLRTAKILQPVYHPITLGGPTPKPYSDGFLAVGDAASQVKPTTGGGIIVGLTCASVAAEVAHEALQQGEFSAKFLSTYKERCDEKLGFDASFMLRMRKMFDALSDRQMDSAIGFCKRLRLEKVLQKMEDVDFQGRAFLHALGNPKTLAAFGYFLYLYFSANP